MDSAETVVIACRDHVQSPTSNTDKPTKMSFQLNFTQPNDSWVCTCWPRDGKKRLYRKIRSTTAVAFAFIMFWPTPSIHFSSLRPLITLLVCASKGTSLIRQMIVFASLKVITIFITQVIKNYSPMCELIGKRILQTL